MRGNRMGRSEKEMQEIGFDRCDKHNVTYCADDQCPQCSQPTPSTPRPDVEGILKEKNQTCYVRTSTAISLCDYIFDLERRHGEVLEREIEVNSLLDRLVMAGRKYLPDKYEEQLHKTNACYKIGAKCTCGYDDTDAALTAAKEHFEKEEKT